MRFMVIVKCSENEGALPSDQLMADMNKFNDELLEAGVLIGYDGLHPRPKAPASTSPARPPHRG